MFFKKQNRNCGLNFYAKMRLKCYFNLYQLQKHFKIYLFLNYLISFRLSSSSLSALKLLKSVCHKLLTYTEFILNFKLQVRIGVNFI